MAVTGTIRHCVTVMALRRIIGGMDELPTAVSAAEISGAP